MPLPCDLRVDRKEMQQELDLISTISTRSFLNRLHKPILFAARLRSQSSITSVLREKPIQKAMPKNCRGAKCVRGAVAKKTPMTGRVVAMPSRMATARSVHLCFAYALPRRNQIKAWV